MKRKPHPTVKLVLGEVIHNDRKLAPLIRQVTRRSIGVKNNNVGKENKHG
jgi:hypothetical protein